MGLIDGQDLPFDRAQLLCIAQSQLVRRQQDVELELLVRPAELVLADRLARRSVAAVADNVEIRRPRRELGLPGGDGRERNDDEKRAKLVQGVKEVREEGDRLDRLAEPHLVRQDAVLALGPQVREPVQPRQLEVFEFASGGGDVVWVLIDFDEGRTFVARVIRRAEGEFGALLANVVGLDLCARNGAYLVLMLPGALVIVETRPFDEVLDASIDFALADDTLDDFVRIEVLLFAFLVDLERLDVLAGDAWGIEPHLVHFVGFDVVIDALETLVALQELVGLVGVVEMGKSFPLDVEALGEATSEWEPCKRN